TAVELIEHAGHVALRLGLDQREVVVAFGVLDRQEPRQHAADHEEQHDGHRDQDDAFQNSWFSPPNTALTESSTNIRRIESVSSSAHGSTRTFSGQPTWTGIVSVTTISSRPDVRRFSNASPENTACVAAAYTRAAPSSLTVLAAALSVPAVSIMSSTITAVLPFTSPIT